MRNEPYIRNTTAIYDKKLLVIAGVEGAGKSSFAGIVRPQVREIFESTLTEEDIAFIRKKKEDNQKRYYQLVLREYASPAFCSFAKRYHGTISDIRELMNTLATINEDGRYNLLLHAFQEWESGNATVAHDVAFRELQLLTPEEMVACKGYTLENVMWRHINVWDCAYDLKANTILVREIVLKQEDKYIRCIRPVFENLMVSVPDHPVFSKWSPLNSVFWGFPCMMTEDGEGKYIEPRLYMEQGTYKNLEDAIADLKDPEMIDFSAVCDDIFGDG